MGTVTWGEIMVGFLLLAVMARVRTSSPFRAVEEPVPIPQQPRAGSWRQTLRRPY